MYRLSKDSRCHKKEYEVIYLKAKNIDEALRLFKNNPEFYLFCGGTDLALKLKNDSIYSYLIIKSQGRELNS